MASQASKKGKKGKGVKGKTLNLNDFLSDGSSGGTSAPGTSYVMNNKSWAEQTDEADECLFLDNKPLPNRAALPTAPRSAQPAELDFSKLPDKPPYTVYLGNIPFDADEDDITLFLRDCNVSQVRLPREGERLKGFGYAEVDDLESLTAALALNDQTIRSRRIRVDVAGPGHQDGNNDRTSGDWRARSDGGSIFGRGSYGGSRRNEDSFGGGGGGVGGGGGGGSAEDSVWRRRTPAEGTGAFESKGGGSRGFEDRGRSGGFDRDQGDRGFGNNRDNRFGNDRGFGGDRDRGFGGDRDRGFGGDRDRGFGGDRDRGFGGDRDRSFGGDRDRGFGGDRDRGFGGDRDRGFGGDRDRGFGGDRDRGFGGDRSFGGDRDRGFGGDRSGGRSRGFDNAEPRDRGFGGDRDRGFGGDRDRDRGNRDRNYGSDRNGGYSGGYTRGNDREGEMDSEPLKERKKLVLTKKSDHTSDSGSAPGSAQQTKSAIFGGAKPVDTAARERAIEERLERERRLEEQERMKSEKEREPVIRRERPERPRRESEGEGRTRHSSSSSGKGGPRPIIARRESERSNEDDSAFHKDEPLSPTSPTTPKSPKTPISPRQDEINLQNVIPAPPPKENAWAKRSEIVSSPPSGSSSAPPTSPPPRELDSRYKGEGSSDGGRQYRESGPPKDNAWKRDGRPAGRGERGGMNKRPGDQGGPGAGRGERRRDDRRENRRSESDDRPARKQPAEMPKYEQPAAPEWSQPTKFSAALADELPESD